MSSLPASAPPPDPPPAVLTAPALWRRLSAWLYEGVLLFGVLALAGLLFSIATSPRHALAHRHQLQVLLFVVLGLYFIYFWIKGQTLAMKTWRIRVVDRRGQPLTFWPALRRYLLSWLWFLPPLAAMAPFSLTGGQVVLLTLGWVVVWALLSRLQPQRQFWHDVWAGTRLMDTRRP
jgi:uncharacterized RDD family membrane protein YckC